MVMIRCASVLGCFALAACLEANVNQVSDELLGTDYYVSPTVVGSSGNGSMASPWSLAYAASCAGGQIDPGDRVNLLGGTYSGGVTITCSGAPNLPVTFRNANATPPVLEGAIPAFASVNNNAWDAVEVRTGHNVYRSKVTYPVASQYTGFISISGAEWLALAPHGEGPVGSVAQLKSDIHTHYVTDPDGVCVNQSVPGGYATVNGAYATAGIATLPAASLIGATWTGPSMIRIYGTNASGGSIVESSPSGITSYQTTLAFKTVTNVTFSQSVTNATVGTRRYLGPGLAYNASDQKIYVRLDNSTPAAQRGRTTVPQIANPNPNQWDLRISSIDSIGIVVKAQYVTVEGLTINHFGVGINTHAPSGPFSSNLIFKNLDVRPGRFGARLGNAHSVRFENCRFDGRMPSTRYWVSRMDIKDFDAPAGALQKTGINTGNAWDVVVIDSQIDHFFDGILASTDGYDFKILNSTFRGNWDDAWQMYYRNYNVEIGYNKFLGAGPSRDWSGSEPPLLGDHPANVGQVFIHHNIFDPHLHQIWWYRGGYSLPAGVPFDSMVDAIALSTHGPPQAGSNKCSFPYKLYNNTFIVAQPSVENGIGTIALVNRHAVDCPQDATHHEVYNNIFVDPAGVSLGRDFLTSGREMYDGNVYASWPAGKHIYTFVHTSGGTTVNYVASPESFRENMTLLNDTKTYPIPSFNLPVDPKNGWEHAGFSVATITFGPAYQPTCSNPAGMSCATGAVDLSASKDKDNNPWPGTSPAQPWRGAVPP